MIMITLNILLTLLSRVESCQEIQVVTAGGDKIVGRSMEYSHELEYWIKTFPKNSEHQFPPHPLCGDISPPAYRNPDPMAAVMPKPLPGVTPTSEFVLEGFTQNGLSASGLLVMGGYVTNLFITEDTPNLEEACKTWIPHTKFIPYVLSKYNTVHEIRTAIRDDTMPTIYGASDLYGAYFPTHWSIVDKTDAIVVYWVDGKIKWADNPAHVVTNQPLLPWHIDNLHNYPNLSQGEVVNSKSTFLKPISRGSGTAGLPGSYSSPDRFVKAYALNELTSKTPKDAASGVNHTMHLMNAATIPRGLMKNCECGSDSDHTRFVSVRDLTNGCMYYHTYLDLRWSYFCLSEIPTGPSTIQMSVESDSYVNITGGLQRIEH